MKKMSFKIFSYDITEYKKFENKLNELSLKGINPIEMGYISSFEKNDKHYFYAVDVLKEEKSAPKKLVRNHLITLYDRYDFRYVGSYRNMIFFRSDSKRKLPKGREKILNEYLENAWINRLILTFIFLSGLVFSVSYMVIQNDVRHLLTNGEILFQFLIPIFCLGAGLLNIGSALRSFQYKAKKEPTNTPFKLLGYGFIVLSCFSLVLGIVLDIVERGRKPIDDSILTLETVGLEPGEKGEYSYSNSMLVHAKSYTDLNDQNQLLFSVVYEVDKDAQSYFDTFKADYVDDSTKEIENNVYVYTIETENDSMIALVGNKIVEITSTLDLLENNNYQKILDFYR